MLRRTLVTAALTLLLAAPASAGPPWIAIEYPANPHHPSTRGALLLVRTYHHSDALAVPVRGTAEGIVAGRRTSVPLDIRSTNIPGVYALRGKPATPGTWVLAITLTQGENATATALVTLDDRGGIAKVDVPATQSRDGWTIPRALQPADVERALRAAVAARPAPNEGGYRSAGLLGLPLLLALGILRRRARRAL